ncbi:hypothetical protein MNBD_NITROSPINAE02-703 [hydrothermal vent metagenome]|uniref:Uncharacterized protein n=1 Tax=hydrothermal vent metagenome TaxID=652676 RepID=A0A3B1BVZ6_9ZZZZ
MKRYLTIYSILLVCGLFIAGCGGGGGGGDSSGESPGITALIIGSWRSDCVVAEGNSVDHIYTFNSSGQGNIKVYGYTGPGCSAQVPSHKIIYFNYSIGATVPVTGIVDIAYEMSINRTSWEVIANGVAILSGGGSPTEYGIVAVDNNILYTGLGVDSPNNTDAGNRPTTFSAFYTRE